MDELFHSSPLLQYMPIDDLFTLTNVSRQFRSFAFCELSHRIKKLQKSNKKAKSTTSPEWLFHRTVVYLYEEYDDFDDKDFMLLIRVSRQLSQIAREYEQMQRQGIRVFAGSLNDHFGRLQWDAQLPNFWCVPILDEHQFGFSCYF